MKVTYFPGCTLRTKAKDLDLWALAKKYGSTLELIHAANPQCGEDTLFLLIPRCR